MQKWIWNKQQQTNPTFAKINSLISGFWGQGEVGWTVKIMSYIVKDLFSTNFSTKNFMMLDGALAYLLAKRYLSNSAGLLFYINIKFLRGNKVWVKQACLANHAGSPYINGSWGCIPLGRWGSGFMINDHIDLNPLSPNIHKQISIHFHKELLGRNW